MHVRQYEDRSDARAIARIQARAWMDAYADLLPADVLASQSPDPDDETVAGWHQSLTANRQGVLLAVDETGERLGFADFRWGDAETKAFVDENEAGLKSIYVDPDSWGNGVGTALLERGISILPEAVETLRLEMLEGNEIGHEFYRAKGFEVTDEASHEIGDEAYPTLVYSLELEASEA
ncbi:acetyltransferase [Halovivax ruber XH-70]|uniref:Acetyltransferase n=1 Tax=Halovivax ruber (strain DSM 18193 / JCM 13892 / XH-70) TaxID=797302 RepID=L0IH13_HALRX|nr:GNAT family N-acetyltransferase [Halovivax ruber]AGB17272.1 acetyltransferase [Halovivax ruber XH-70]